ncbi:group 3 secretory phospholipase A2 isoform X2 [Puntigrus tetrazona]|uniref:group 3 secretory phospholipase A2 isoform X2 n=1 Tax=Puntigrus tetrazona TaxID=1606681 RepID=UPI001C88FA4F|nr:group 3 secretory phospholipase A2 isoform X2 [Puntigrus tetrazona]
MQSKHLLRAVLYLSVLFRACFGAESSDTFCIWTRSASEGRTQHAFLRRTQTSLLLYDSIWDENDRLFSCVTSDEQPVIESYLYRCREDGSFSKALDGRFDVRELVEPHGPCEAAGAAEEFTASVRRTRDLGSVESDGLERQDGGESSRQMLQRSKRALMIPGTLWCGSGNKAMAFGDLGVFDDTDKCCREHDHCKDTIASFSYNHGVFNTNVFTLSHCDCDNRCAIYELAQYAVVKDAANYTDALPEEDLETLEAGFHRAVAPGRNQVTRNTEESLTAEDSRSGGEEPSPVSTWPGPSVTTLQSRKSDASVPPTDAPKITDRTQKGKFETCDLYRDLDSCHLRIPALQEKFGLRNPGVRTLYHCNCTARLVQKISSKEMDETDPVHSLLMDFVSQSCFTLPQSENCLNGKSCSEAQLVQNWRKDVTGGRHLVDFKRKLKRTNPKRSKRKDSPVRLYKKCIRMHAKLQRPPLPERKLS